MDDSCVETLRSELARFSDPGVEPNRVGREGRDFVATLTRNGISFTLKSSNFYTESISLSATDGTRKTFSTFRSMLASEFFADLSLWASRQRNMFAISANEGLQIEPQGILDQGAEPVDTFGKVEDVIDNLSCDSTPLRVLLIDGPAGVGKTTLIQHLARRAAETFETTNSRLFLHVRSRGKVLSNIDDLMASSLQAMRLNVTFDQVPVLVRHGLVILAIDGFDELGDPEGYGHAWGQLNDLIGEIKHDAFIILGGRETFIGRKRLVRSVMGLKAGSKVVELTLDETPPARAEQWLLDFGVSRDAVGSLDEAGMLEKGSFALRPFFLSYLARELREGSELLAKYDRLSDVLPIVVEVMVDREVRRFRGEVESALTISGVRAFLMKFLAEVSREMAGDESESIAETMLSWIVDVSVPADTDHSIVSLLKGRAGAIAFLALDDRPGYRRFAHSQFFNYFLSRSVVDSICTGDIPKWLRRGSVDADFLVAFVPFLRVESAVVRDEVTLFASRLTEISEQCRAFSDSVQLNRNLGALSFSMLALPNFGMRVHCRAPEIQYAYAGAGTLFGEVKVDFIHTLDARSCDFTAVDFSETLVGTALVDDVTRWGSERPFFNAIRRQREDGSAIDYFDPEEVQRILARLTPEDTVSELGSTDSLALLDKLARSRRYWFKPENDDLFGPFDDLPGWAELRDVLIKHSMIRADANRQASGTKADWIHIKNPRAILLRSTEDAKIRALLLDLGWKER